MYANSGLIKFGKDTVRQVKTVTVNEIGEEVETWADGDIIKALILPLSSKHSRDLPGVTDTSTHIAFSLSNFVSNERLKQGGTIYLVQHPDEWISHNQAILERVS